MRTVVWFRDHDLRMHDHVPLSVASAGETIPLYVLEPFVFAPSRARERPSHVQFLVESIHALAKQLTAAGAALVIAEGKANEIIPRLCHSWRADRVVAHGTVDPIARASEARVREAIGAKVTFFDGETLLPPGTLRTGAGVPYVVFTPFARAFLETATIGKPLPAPEKLPPLPDDVASFAQIPTLEALGLLRNPALPLGGEPAGRARLHGLLDNGLERYDELRNRMDLDGTSRLSADLKFGTLSIRGLWTDIERVETTQSSRTFLRELLWREFSHSTLWDRPDLLEKPFRPAFADFPWKNDERQWQAWSHGETGYPIVDAAARQLLAEGFVHNRARMIAASFLTKHLLVDYRWGEAHYMRYLVDGDAANNNMGWQWSAGCGCDAQPYFRVFNPVTQGKKFDPEGSYVRRYLPALAGLPSKFIHAPWEAPSAVLERAGVLLGTTYPFPVVEHRHARERFLSLASEHLGRGRKWTPAMIDRSGGF